MNSKNINEKHEKDMARIRGLCLIDDEFMSKVFEDKECAEVLLRAILKKRDLKVTDVRVQYDIKNLQGRSIRLDILAEDEAGKLYNVEVQRNNHGAAPKRARYNSSLLDANITDAGEDYKNLAETYVIFITENDIFNAGKPLYHVERMVKETKKSFGDEAHIIYVNSQIQNNSELGRLMHDFYCQEPKNIKNRTIKKRVKFFKEDKEGVDIMCKAFDEIRYEGELIGQKKQSIETAKKMLNAGKFSISEIAEYADLDEAYVKVLKQEDDALKAV